MPSEETPASPAPAAPAPVTYSEADLTSRVEKARTEEKQKLYSEIQSLKKKAEDLESMSATQLKDLQTKLAEATSQLQTLEKARTPSGDVDIKALIADVSAQIRTELTTRHQAETKALTDRLDKMEKEALAQALARVKQEVIAAAKGRIIPSLVRGETEDQLRQSAEEAKAEYERIVSEAAASVPAPAAPEAPAAFPPTLNPRAQSGGSAAPQPAGVENFKGTRDPAAFKARRESLLADLNRRYG